MTSVILASLLAMTLASPIHASPPESTCVGPAAPRCTLLLSTGIEMAYVEMGPASGPPVILLHGYTDSIRSWSLLMPSLHELRPDLHLIAVDLRGHGESSMPAMPWCPRDPARCFHRRDMARDVIAFIDALAISRATFVSHSMGSFVAEEIGLSYRDRVDRLVLIGNGMIDRTVHEFLTGFIFDLLLQPWVDSLVAQGYRWPEDAYLLTPLDADPDAAELLAEVWTYDPIANPTLTSAIAQDIATMPLGTIVGALLTREDPRIEERLRHLDVPTLVLWGCQDSIFYRDPDETVLIDALTQAAKGKGSFVWKQYGVIPLDPIGYQLDDLGHALQWEAPTQVALDIDAYLRTGMPTPDRYRTDAPNDITSIVTEPGQATIIAAQ